MWDKTVNNQEDQEGLVALLPCVVCCGMVCRLPNARRFDLAQADGAIFFAHSLCRDMMVFAHQWDDVELVIHFETGIEILPCTALLSFQSDMSFPHHRQV